MHNQQVRTGVLESLVYSPVRSFFTFGYGGVNEEEQAKFEKKMDEHRQRALSEQEEDQAKRNAYPGLEER